MSLVLALHVVAATLWVGGMLFAHQVLRPAAGPLDAPARLALWRRVFQRFFPMVWGAIAVLLASGYGMVLGYLGGFAAVGRHVHLMQVTGIVMMLLFGHLYFAPWRRFRAAVDGGDHPAAAGQLAQIRRIVGINLVLGVATVAIAAGGRYWP